MLMLQLSVTVHDLICLLSSLFVYWRRTRDAQKITKRSPYPPIPFRSDPFTLTNIRSIPDQSTYYVGPKLLVSNTATLQYQVFKSRVYLFAFFGGSSGQRLGLASPEPKASSACGNWTSFCLIRRHFLSSRLVSLNCFCS